MTVQVEVLDKVTGEVVEAFGRLLPQLSSSATPLGQEAVEAIIECPANTVFIARSAGAITGTLTLVMFPLPSGMRAWIEDVVVDQSARRQGIAEALTREALHRARQAGARTVDLTSRPSRVAAGGLYEKLGFTIRDTRVYRFAFAD